MPSLSPSMDIQISSNFERYLFDLLGRDPAAVAASMTTLKAGGSYAVTPDQLARARSAIHAYRCDDATTLATIKTVYIESGVLLDPHTAVGVHAAQMALRDGAIPTDQPLVTLACAHPAKFPDAVEHATGIRPELT